MWGMGMSEKRKIQRFNLDEGRIWEAIEGLSPFKTTYTLEEVCEKLNEQEDKITELEIELTDCKNRKEQSEYKNTKLIAKIDFLERVIDGDV